MSLETIKNFVAVNELYATAGQPTEDELCELRDHGFEVVVNLGLLDPRYCLPDEAAAVARLGMEYHHVPVVFTEPKLSDFNDFFELMERVRGRKVFVHCALNYRVSCFTALFAESELGWSEDEANAHVNRLWEPNEVWQEFMQVVRSNRKRALEAETR